MTTVEIVLVVVVVYLVAGGFFLGCWDVHADECLPFSARALIRMKNGAVVLGTALIWLPMLIYVGVMGWVDDDGWWL